MAANHKLSNLLKGRGILTTQNQGDTLTMGLDDGSQVTIRVGESTNSAISGIIMGVRQQDTTLSLDFEDGSTMEISTAEPTSSVMVRDKEGKMEYAD